MPEPADTNIGTGVIEEKTMNIQIYPNPTKGTVNIDGGFEMVIIYNSNGLIIKEGVQHTHDLNQLPRGFYFIRVIAPGGFSSTYPVFKE
jgi:hypothetical protein